MGYPTALKRRYIVLFWLAVAACLLPFVLLAFLNDMAADDFVYCNLYRQYGFFASQGFIYHNWAGRYTSTFLNHSFIGAGLLSRWYWLPTLLLFAGTGWAVFFLVKTVDALLPEQNSNGRRQRIFAASFVLVILLIYVQADIGSAYYWFSSAIVYQTSMILFLLLAGCLIRRLAKPGRAWGHDGLNFLLIVCIPGCNEMAAILLLFVLAAVTGSFLYGRRSAPGYLWFYLGAAILTCAIIALTSGTLHGRLQLMNNHMSWLAIFPVVCFQFTVVLFSVFKEPLFWISGLLLFLWGARLSQRKKGNTSAAIIGNASAANAENAPASIIGNGNRLVARLILLLAVVFLSLLTLMMGSRGSLPARALNNLTGVLTVVLLGLGFWAGIVQGNRLPGNDGRGIPPVVFLGLVAIMVLTSTNYRDAWKSILSGYFRHAVTLDRDRRLTDAGQRHQQVVRLLAYPDAIEEKIRETFPHGVPTLVHNQIHESPPLLFPFDGASKRDQPAYCRYYGVDSIIVGGY